MSWYWRFEDFGTVSLDTIFQGHMTLTDDLDCLRYLDSCRPGLSLSRKMNHPVIEAYFVTHIHTATIT
jgi:hypothetical protein